MTESHCEARESDAATTPLAVGAAPGLTIQDLLIAVLIVTLTAAAFWPCLPGEFLHWDDDKLLLENDRFHGFGAENLRWMLTTTLLGHYQPITWLSYALDWTLWRLDSFAFHRTNLILFIASVWVFYRLTVRLLAVSSPDGGSSLAVLRGASALGAILYAVHPQRVETVAWITNRAYLLSGLLVLLSLWSYLRYAGHRKRNTRSLGFYLLAVACFALSLLCRANAVALPFVLVIMDVIPLRRLNISPRRWLDRSFRSVWLEKVPFALLAAGGAALAAWAKSTAETVENVPTLPPAGRLVLASFAVCFHLLKTAWPVNLLPLYEKPVQMDPFEPIYLAAGAFVVIVTVFLIALRRRVPAVLACWLAYVVLLAPVSGLVQIGAQIAADRYTQLTCLSWFVLLAAGLFRAWPPAPRPATRRLGAVAIWLVCVALVVVSLAASRQQCRVWLDSETLWSTTVERDPECWTALGNLAALRARSGRHREAVALLEKAARMRPEKPDVFAHLGGIALEQGRVNDAAAYLHRAESLGGIDAQLFMNLATLAVVQGDLVSADEYIHKALALEPLNPEVHNNLGMIHFHAGRLDQAEHAFNEALRLRPDYPKARENLHNLHEYRKQNGGRS